MKKNNDPSAKPNNNDEQALWASLISTIISLIITSLLWLQKIGASTGHGPFNSFGCTDFSGILTHLSKYVTQNKKCCCCGQEKAENLNRLEEISAIESNRVNDFENYFPPPEPFEITESSQTFLTGVRGNSDGLEDEYRRVDLNRIDTLFATNPTVENQSQTMPKDTVNKNSQVSKSDITTNKMTVTDQIAVKNQFCVTEQNPIKNQELQSVPSTKTVAAQQSKPCFCDKATESSNIRVKFNKELQWSPQSNYDDDTMEYGTVDESALLLGEDADPQNDYYADDYQDFNDSYQATDICTCTSPVRTPERFNYTNQDDPYIAMNRRSLSPEYRCVRYSMPVATCPETCSRNQTAKVSFGARFTKPVRTEVPQNYKRSFMPPNTSFNRSYMNPGVHTNQGMRPVNKVPCPYAPSFSKQQANEKVEEDNVEDLIEKCSCDELPKE